MPRLALVTALITFECTESTSTPAGIPKNGPSVIFNIHQWELGTDSQSPFLQFQSSPFISGSSQFIRSFISATKSITQCGISAGDMGRHMDMALISSLNWEIATASPINHNEATSGSVKVEIALHLRRVLGQTRLYSSHF